MPNENDNQDIQKMFADFPFSEQSESESLIEIERATGMEIDIAADDAGERVFVITDASSSGEIVARYPPPPQPAPHYAAPRFAVEKSNGETLSGSFAGGDAEFVEILEGFSITRIPISEISLIKFGNA